MAYKFNVTRGNAILNFSEEFCQSRCQLIESESFAKVLEKYIRNIKNYNLCDLILYYYNSERNQKKLKEAIHEIVLQVIDTIDVKDISKSLEGALKSRRKNFNMSGAIIKFLIESIYENQTIKKMDVIRPFCMWNFVVFAKRSYTWRFGSNPPS